VAGLAFNDIPLNHETVEKNSAFLAVFPDVFPDVFPQEKEPETLQKH
jgi:hypothetical protein